MENNQQTLQEKTFDQYKRVIAKHIIPRLGGIRLADLRLTRIEQFYSELLQASVGIRTIRIVYTILHRTMEKAMRYGFLITNPTQGAALPRTRAVRCGFWTRARCLNS